MDNIEQLLRDADPRRRRDSAGPLPLDLDEPGPVFAQQPVRQAPRPRRSWGPLALGTMVTAVAVAAVIFWSPWNAPLPEPGPAITPTPSPTAPSESSSANPTAPSESGALPNGLFPAYDGVHFADDQACRALSLPQIQLADAQGKLSTPGYDTRAFSLIGCVEGFAAFTPSEQFKLEERVQDTSGGMLIAKWDPEAEHWVSSPSNLTGEGVEVYQEYLSWPLLRGYTYETDQTPEQRMNLAVKEMGIDPEIVAELFGPNVPSWMETETSTERVPYGNSVLEVTHPVWTQVESMNAADGKVLDPATVDPKDAATYHLGFFDAHGKTVFNLAIFEDDRPGEDGTETCNDPAGTYTLNGLSPTSVVVDEGKLALGLITQTDYFGIERSAVSLVPANSAAQGKLCDLATAFHLNGKMVQSDAWTGSMGFKDAAERNTYLASSEYLRAQDEAASLKLK